jgi:uncharacterized protein with NRDE domain
VVALKARLRDALDAAPSVDALAARLFDALADPSEAPDEALPRTGVPLERERQLSAAFIRAADIAYGTRSSMLLIAEHDGGRRTTHVLERSFDAHGGAPVLRRARLPDWPPVDPSARNADDRSR